MAAALKRAETTLRNWQDDPDSPRNDVDKMLHEVADLRAWVAGHVLAEVERSHTARNTSSSATLHAGETPITETMETYGCHPRNLEE